MNEVTLMGTLTSPPVYHCTEHGQDLLRFQLTTESLPTHERRSLPIEDTISDPFPTEPTLPTSGSRHASVRRFDRTPRTVRRTAHFTRPIGSTSSASRPAAPYPTSDSSEPRQLTTTQLHHCRSWGPAALDLHAHLKVGDRLLIRGELTYRYRRLRSGETVRVTEITVRGYTYLGREE